MFLMSESTNNQSLSFMCNAKSTINQSLRNVLTLQFSTKTLWVLYNTKISEVKEGVCKTSSDADRVYDEAILSQ